MGQCWGTRSHCRCASPLPSKAPLAVNQGTVNPPVRPARRLGAQIRRLWAGQEVAAMPPSQAGVHMPEPTIVPQALTPSVAHCPTAVSSILCQISALHPSPASLGRRLGRGGRRDDGAQYWGQPWCRSERPSHPPPDFILFPSQCLAAYRSRAFYSPQLQPRRAPGQLPAVAPLARCQQPRPGQGDGCCPRGPRSGSARGEHGLRRKADN